MPCPPGPRKPGQFCASGAELGVMTGAEASVTAGTAINEVIRNERLDNSNPNSWSGLSSWCPTLHLRENLLERSEVELDESKVHSNGFQRLSESFPAPHLN